MNNSNYPKSLCVCCVWLCRTTSFGRWDVYRLPFTIGVKCLYVVQSNSSLLFYKSYLYIVFSSVFTFYLNSFAFLYHFDFLFIYYFQHLLLQLQPFSLSLYFEIFFKIFLFLWRVTFNFLISCIFFFLPFFLFLNVNKNSTMMTFNIATTNRRLLTWPECHSWAHPTVTTSVPVRCCRWSRRLKQPSILSWASWQPLKPVAPESAAMVRRPINFNDPTASR